MRYKPNVRYIRKIGTTDVFPWTMGLASRPDMEEIDPFRHNAEDKVIKHPELPECSLDPFTKEITGLDREHVREGLSQCKNKLQKIFWCLLNLWEKSPGLLKEFKPRYRDLSILMGPTFTKEELKFALEIFKSNPNKEYLMSEAVDGLTPAEITDSE
jgi:hypothetical protein